MKNFILFLSLLSFSFVILQAQTAKDYREAAEQGDASAQYDLGSCYYIGKGVKKDYKQALYWYQKAAEQEFALAQCAMGICFYDGTGVKKDYTEAAYWYQKAAEQGVSYAQRILGTCYLLGEGVAKDDQKAVYWYQKAAEQGDDKAEFLLGFFYISGEAQDDIQAIYWFQKAAEQGNVEAQKYFSYLSNKIKKQEKKDSLPVLFDKVQAALDENSYNPNSAISLIKEYLNIAPEKDENKGELLNTLGLLYANNGDIRNLWTTIETFQSYNTRLAEPEWQGKIQELKAKYDVLVANMPTVFDKDIIGYWVSTTNDSETNTPLFIISFMRTADWQFVSSSLKIMETSPCFNIYNISKEAKASLTYSQNFFLDIPNKRVRGISGTEKLHLGDEFAAIITANFAQELGKGLRNYISMNDKNFFSSTLKGSAVDVGVQVTVELASQLAVSKKQTQVWSFDLQQNNNGELEGKFLRNIYTSYSTDPERLDQEDKTENIKFIKTGKIIFATSEGIPIYLGGAAESDYRNSELYNINQRYKSNSKEKKAAINEYNKQIYKKLGWIIK